MNHHSCCNPLLVMVYVGEKRLVIRVNSRAKFGERSQKSGSGSTLRRNCEATPLAPKMGNQMFRSGAVRRVQHCNFLR